MIERSPIDQIERVRNSLASVIVLAFIAGLPLFVFKTIPEGNRDIVVYMVGQLSGMALMALGFYFTNKVGQDALDAKRTENTGKLAEAITATANASLPTDEPLPVKVINAAEDPVPTVEGKAT